MNMIRDGLNIIIGLGDVHIAFTWRLQLAVPLFFYDYLLTLPQEIKCVWQRPKHGAAVLFFLNRYVAFFNRLIILVQAISWSGETEPHADMICNVVWRLSEGCTIIMYLSVAGFATLRMYAVWGKNQKIGGCILVLGLIRPLIDIYFVTTLSLSALAPPFTGCGQQTTLNFPSADLLFTVFAILFECVIIALTWTKTLDVQRILRRKSIGAQRSASYLIFRDGEPFFFQYLTILAFNSSSNKIDNFLSMQLSLSIFGLLAICFEDLNNVTSLINTLRPMLITRFILNLREDFLAAPNELTSSLLPELPLATQRSSRLIGNLGAPVYADDYIASLSEGEDEVLTVMSVSDNPLQTGLMICP
ncbi:hypothetical protein BDW22DRAFT_1364146 [Trametopsis cervina]|nr:hypothetical protein BDW22DRAFT_1364146 [Trametopsis cervina]